MSKSVFRWLRGVVISRLEPAASWHLGRHSWHDAQRLGRRFGAFIWRIDRRDRERALEHLRIAFPDLPADERRKLAESSFHHLGAGLAECLYTLRNGIGAAAEHLRIEGWRHIAAAQEERRPVLVVTGHCGNWELLGPAFHSRGVELTAIVRQMQEGWAEDFVVHFRQRLGTRLIRRGDSSAPRQLLRVLRGGGNLLVLADQDFRTGGVWVPFFGRPAHTPTGPAEMAIKYSMVVIPTFCERLEDGSHLIRFQAPLELQDDVEAATARITREIEMQIRRRPEQWTWMHRRWRRRPPQDGGGEEVLRS